MGSAPFRPPGLKSTPNRPRRVVCAHLILECALGAALVLAPAGLLGAQAPPDDIGRPAVLTGVVRDSMQRPIMLATLQVEDTQISAVSDTAGRFRLAGIGPGAVRVSVMRIGFHPFTLDTTIGPGDTLEVAMTLRGIPTLEEIETRATRLSRWTATGFRDRQRTGIGKFVSPERVDSLRHLPSPARMLRDISGIDIVCGPGGCTVVPRWTSCMMLFIDGMPHGTMQLESALWTTHNIYAFEVYDRASRVPSRFMTKLPTRAGGIGGLSRSSGCGALVVWTKARAP